MARTRLRGAGAGVIVLAAITLALGGCQSDTGPDPALANPAPMSVTAPDADEEATAAPPKAISIPSIGAESSLVPVGLTTEGTMEIPPVEQPLQAAWYRLGAVPGNPGPAIIVGHVDGNKKPGIFYRLRQLSQGAEVVITQGDGHRARFTVTHTTQVAKDQLPDDVFAGTAQPELRLITCGGAFDKTQHSYTDNIIVHARLTT